MSTVELIFVRIPWKTQPSHPNSAACLTLVAELNITRRKRNTYGRLYGGICIVKLRNRWNILKPNSTRLSARGSRLMITSPCGAISMTTPISTARSMGVNIGKFPSPTACYNRSSNLTDECLT